MTSSKRVGVKEGSEYERLKEEEGVRRGETGV